MPSITDQSYLLGSQYRDSSNLEARIAVHRLFSSNPVGWFRWYCGRQKEYHSPHAYNPPR